MLQRGWWRWPDWCILTCLLLLLLLCLLLSSCSCLLCLLLSSHSGRLLLLQGFLLFYLGKPFQPLQSPLCHNRLLIFLLTALLDPFKLTCLPRLAGDRPQPPADAPPL